MDFLVNLIVILFLTLVFFVLSLAGVTWIVYKEEEIGCVEKWEKMEPKYSFFSGCLIKTKNGEVIPSSNYRINENGGEK
jgi:hypothetical protein